MRKRSSRLSYRLFRCCRSLIFQRRNWLLWMMCKRKHHCWALCQKKLRRNLSFSEAGNNRRSFNFRRIKYWARNYKKDWLISLKRTNFWNCPNKNWSKRTNHWKARCMSSCKKWSKSKYNSRNVTISFSELSDKANN